MLIGVAVPNRGPLASPSLLRETILLAERTGYDSLWFADHVVIPEEETARHPSRWYDPWVAASYACALTSRVKLCFGVIVLPYRSPLPVAKAVASLDQLSGGRVIAGVGSGYMKGEFEALGVSYADRGRRTDEYIHALKVLWTNPLASFEGEFTRFSRVILDPRPLQQPHPPIWIGGASKAAIRRSVALGDGWQPPFSLGTPHSEVESWMGELHREMAKQGRTRPLTVSFQAPRIRIAGVPAGTQPEYRDGQRVPMNGTPEEIIQDLRFYQELGADQVVVEFRHAPTPEGHLEAMEYFIRHIAPAVRESS